MFYDFNYICWTSNVTIMNLALVFMLKGSSPGVIRTSISALDLRHIESSRLELVTTSVIQIIEQRPNKPLAAAYNPKARPPIAATRTAATTPVPLTLRPTPESGKTPGSPDPETSLPLVSPVLDEVEVGAAELVEIVTGLVELFKEVAEYGAEKV